MGAKRWSLLVLEAERLLVAQIDGLPVWVPVRKAAVATEWMFHCDVIMFAG
jgi:hypothetical protein